MKIFQFDLPVDLQLSTADAVYFSSYAGGRLQATVTSAQEIFTDTFELTKAILESTPPQTVEEPDEYTESLSSMALAPVVCSHYRIVQVARGEEALQGREDADAALAACCQREAPLRLLPPIIYWQGASPLHEGENAELLREANRLQPLQRPTAAPNSQRWKSDSANT